MRTVGLLALLAGGIVLILPTINQLVHRSFHIVDGTLIGGALLCMGVAALALSRSSARR